MPIRREEEQIPENTGQNIEKTSDSGEIPAEKDVSRKTSRWLRMGIGICAGALLGFGYYYFVGCESGGCPLTSNPAITVSYGAILGGVAASG